MYYVNSGLPNHKRARISYYKNDNKPAINIVLLFLSLLTPLQSWAESTSAVTEYHYKVIDTLSHSDALYTQGIEIYRGHFYESAGRYGESRLIQRSLDSSEAIQTFNLSDKIFAEGLTLLNNKIYQLSWKSQRGFVYDISSFKQIASFSYQGQGWGLCNNGSELIMSNGSDQLTFLNPDNFSVTKKIAVSLDGAPVKKLNELEWVNGLIYANIWQSDWIVIIDPDSGVVVGKADLSGLLPKMLTTAKTDVLNGIAYDHDNKKLYVTGKYWPRIYQLELEEKPIENQGITE